VQHHAQVGARVTQAVDRGHRRHDDGIGPFQQGLGRGQAHLLDVFVDRCVFLDIGVGGRHVGLGLVVVVVGDEILHRVVGKQLVHLPVQLGGERLVRRKDQGRPLHCLDHVGDGIGLARPGHAQQGLVAQPVLQALHQLRDGLRLIAGGLEGTFQLELFSHGL